TNVVSDTALPMVMVSVSNELSCTALTATLSTTATPGVTYLWSTGELTATIIAKAAGPYSVTVTAPNGATASVNTAVFSNTDIPVVTLSVSNTLTPIQFTSTISSSVTGVTGAVSYQWSTGETTPNITVSVAGPYSVTVTGANGCSAVVTTTVFSNTDLAMVTAGVSNTLTCAQPTATISTTASPDVVTYLWSTGATTPSISVNMAGPYSVTVTAQNGTTASTTVTVVSDATLPVIVTTAPAVCTGETLIVSSAISTTNAAYSWTGPNGFTANTGAISIPNATTANSGSYTVTVTDLQTGCSSVTVVSAVVNPLPDSFSLVAKEATCTGGNSLADGQVIATNFGAGDRYDISLGGSYTGATSYALAKPIPAGGVLVDNILRTGVAQTYTVRLYNASGCYAQKTVTLQNPLCNCPPAKCVPFVIQKTKSARVTTR
ncbi:immunoglobulin domain-containing protein, partial [Spirosoma fluminis]